MLEENKTEFLTQWEQTNGYVCARVMLMLVQMQWDQQEQDSH